MFSLVWMSGWCQGFRRGDSQTRSREKQGAWLQHVFHILSPSFLSASP